MPSLPAWNLTRTLAGGIAVLLSLAACPNIARAGCGDHVVILSKKTSDADKPPVAPVPCTGPNCSLKQAPPAPLPSAPIHAKLLPVDAILLTDSAADHDTGRHLLPDLVSLPVNRPAVIFRPPRCG